MRAYSRGRIQSMLRVIDNARTADAKGDALEKLAKYLFENVTGIECSGKNILDSPRAHELDLAFWNDQRASTLYFLDAVLIVECKATGRPVGSNGVGWFAAKLQARDARHGVLVALNGISGKPNSNTSAHSEVLTALIKGTKILVLTRAEILSLRDSDGLSALLKRKLLRLTLDRIVQIDQKSTSSRRGRSKKSGP